MQRTETPRGVRHSLREALAQEAGHENTKRFYRFHGQQLPWASYRGKGPGSQTPIQTLQVGGEGEMTHEHR